MGSENKQRIFLILTVNQGYTHRGSHQYKQHLQAKLEWVETSGLISEDNIFTGVKIFSHHFWMQ